MIAKKKYKVCRRLGPGVYEQCQTQKFVMSEAKRGKRTGMKRPKALSDFGTQLIEKQRIRFSYGISEKQFSNYVKASVEKKASSAADTLFQNLETRLDNVAYRLGLAHTRGLARQMVSHGHLTVNGTKVTIPSYRVKEGDIISIREGSKKSALFTELGKRLKNYSTPAWLTFDLEKLEGKVVGAPKQDSGMLAFTTVLEFYSR